MNKKIRVYYRWVVWGVLCLSYVAGIIHRMGMGVIRADLENTFHMSAVTFAAFGSIYFYVYMVMQIPAGMLVDSIGVRYTAASGTALAAAGSVLLGLSPSVFAACAGRLLVGLGVSVLYISILKTQSSWFGEREFGTLTGLINVLGSLGSILAQTPLVLLVSLITWRYSFVSIGIFGFFIAALCYTFIRNKPSDIGLPSVAGLAAEDVKAENTENTENTEKSGVMHALAAVCRNFYTWPLLLMYACFYGPYIALTGTWGQSYLESVYGMSDVKAADYIIIPILGFLTASVLTGWASDRLLKRKLPIMIQGTIFLLSWAALTLIYKGKPPVTLLGVLFFAIGFSAAAYIPTWACGKEVNDPAYAGVSTAVVNSGGFVGAALIPLLMGRVLDRYSNIFDSRQLYNRAFLICLASVAIGYALIFFIKETNCRNVFKSARHVRDKGI